MTEFRILGPLEVVDGGVTLELPGGKPRALLARLLLDVNRTISVDAIVDSLWGDDVPASATKMIQVYVSQLRKVLPHGVLRTHGSGYALEVAPEAVDLERFTQLRAGASAALAEGDTAMASGRLRTALSLWRGTALAEFAAPFATAQAAHLEELRLACLEDRIEVDLALGRHADLVGELRLLASSQPLRERPRTLLMLALYRAGRQAEALAVYSDFRRTLQDELGMEPPAALNELQRRVLRQDPTLSLAARQRPAPLGRPVEAFVGRADELERLARAYDAAATGHATTVLIAGPAGIGKTLIAGQLVEQARGRGATVLSGRCIDLVGAGLPYLPLVEALRDLRGSPALEGLRELPRLLPDLAGSAPATADGDGTEPRLRLFGEVFAVLERLSRDAPVVLLLEDLHWADGSTLDLIAFLANAVEERRILIVATYRSEATRPEDALHRIGAGLRRARSTVTVELGPMPREEIEALVAESVDEPLSAELTAAVCARSEGNPFFAKELAAAAARGEPRLPRALHELLLAEVGRLDASSRSLLQIVAAAGRDVPYRLLAAVMRLSESWIVESLRQAVDHHVLVADQSAGSFRFRHALFAEAVYATLLPGEREELHARLAGALATRGAPAGELAQHWVAAGRPVEALEASLQAARDAQAVSGLSEALRHLEHVLELWDDVPSAEDLAGVALPAVLVWAAELAGVTGPDDDVGVSEARELYPLVVVLESIAVRQSPPLDRRALDAMRSANARMREAANDPSAAIVADDDFHTHLTASCGNESLLAALRPVRRALLRYEQIYMRESARVERSVAQHDTIIDALERGDHAQAAQRLRENLTRGLPDLAEALER